MAAWTALVVVSSLTGMLSGCERSESSSRTATGAAENRATSVDADRPGNQSPAERLAERLRAMPRSAPAAAADRAAEQALAMLTAGRNEGAESALRFALHDRPQAIRLQFLMALAIHKQSRYEEARRWYDAVVDSGQATPEIDQLPHFYGWCLYYLGRPEEARVAFEEHLRRVGDEADSLFGLGVIALEDDRVEDAEALLIRSIESIDARSRNAARDAAKAHVRLGDVYVRIERLDEAERHLRRAVGLHADHYEGWAKLARLLHRLGRPDDAAEAQRQHDEAQRRVGRG